MGAANELSSFFMSVFVKENDTDGLDIDFAGISLPTNSMLDVNIYVDDVCKKLKQLKDDKSQDGWDLPYGPQEDGRDSYTPSESNV